MLLRRTVVVGCEELPVVVVVVVVAVLADAPLLAATVATSLSFPNLPPPSSLLSIKGDCGGNLDPLLPFDDDDDDDDEVTFAIDTDEREVELTAAAAATAKDEGRLPIAAASAAAAVMSDPPLPLPPASVSELVTTATALSRDIAVVVVAVPSSFFPPTAGNDDDDDDFVRCCCCCKQRAINDDDMGGVRLRSNLAKLQNSAIFHTTDVITIDALKLFEKVVFCEAFLSSRRKYRGTSIFKTVNKPLAHLNFLSGVNCYDIGSN